MDIDIKAWAGLRHPVRPLDEIIMSDVQAYLDKLTKPQGSLGALEQLVCRYCGARKRKCPAQPQKRLLVCSAAASAMSAAAAMAEPAGITVKGLNAVIKQAGFCHGQEAAAAAREAGVTVIGLWAEPTASQAVMEALCGVVLTAAEQRILVVLDGLAAVRAAAEVCQAVPVAKEYLVVAQCADRAFYQMGRPLLKLASDYSCGCGAIVVLKLLDAGLKVLHEMATFSAAGVQPAVCQQTGGRSPGQWKRIDS